MWKRTNHGVHGGSTTLPINLSWFPVTSTMPRPTTLPLSMSLLRSLLSSLLHSIASNVHFRSTDSVADSTHAWKWIYFHEQPVRLATRLDYGPNYSPTPNEIPANHLRMLSTWTNVDFLPTKLKTNNTHRNRDFSQRGTNFNRLNQKINNKLQTPVVRNCLLSKFRQTVPLNVQLDETLNEITHVICISIFRDVEKLLVKKARCESLWKDSRGSVRMRRKARKVASKMNTCWTSLQKQEIGGPSSSNYGLRRSRANRRHVTTRDRLHNRLGGRFRELTFDTYIDRYFIVRSFSINNIERRARARTQTKRRVTTRERAVCFLPLYAVGKINELCSSS